MRASRLIIIIGLMLVSSIALSTFIERDSRSFRIRAVKREILTPKPLFAAIEGGREASDFMIRIHDANSVGMAVSNRGEFGC
ncbi:MAG: hypothetical protein ACE5OP_10360 [Candidatus Glassbacteria bacterium]